jgi:hypothetical protein
MSFDDDFRTLSSFTDDLSALVTDPQLILLGIARAPTARVLASLTPARSEITFLLPNLTIVATLTWLSAVRHRR